MSKACPRRANLARHRQAGLAQTPLASSFLNDKQGIGEEWQSADQADVVGYVASEVQLFPESEFTLLPRMPVHWHPSVGPAQMGDTILVSEEGPELLTKATDWPLLYVTVKGKPVYVPDLLVRETSAPASASVLP